MQIKCGPTLQFVTWNAVEVDSWLCPWHLFHSLFSFNISFACTVHLIIYLVVFLSFLFFFIVAVAFVWFIFHQRENSQFTFHARLHFQNVSLKNLWERMCIRIFHSQSPDQIYELIEISNSQIQLVKCYYLLIHYFFYLSASATWAKFILFSYISGVFQFYASHVFSVYHSEAFCGAFQCLAILFMSIINI